MKKIKDFLNKITFATPTLASEIILNTSIKNGYILFVGMHGLAEYISNERYRKSFDEANIVFCDSVLIQFLNILKSKKVVPRSPGPDVTNLLVKSFQFTNIKVTFFGGKKGLLKNLNNKNMDQIVPGLIEESKISTNHIELQKLKNNKSRYIFIGLGCPKQEIISNKITSEMKNSILIPVGAALNFVSKDEKRAPLLVRLINLEFLWRIFQNPKVIIPRILKSISIIVREIIKN